jgi:hypothetical protein
MNSAAAAPAGRGREARSAGARSSCGKGESRRLLPPLDQTPQRVHLALPLVRDDLDEAHTVAATFAVATAVALGLREGPEPHGDSL